MPRYEYRCEANHRVVEVAHPMSERFSTWGDVCQHLAGDPEFEAGHTPADSPVEKVLSLSFVNQSKPARATVPPAGGCGQGCGCFPN